MAYYDSSNAVFERIEAYTIQLEQTPLEAYTSAARATFLKTLQAAANDMTWLVYEIRMSHKNLAEIKHFKLSADKYNPPNEAFIAKALAARNRFAACFPAVKDIVLDGTHEMDKFAVGNAMGNAMGNAKDHVAYIEEALGKI